ncbi:MAG: DUF2726 domain-containing protein [Nitrospirales bacterium]|nr:DUF2726 domain-containing protein [Nitrospirales bacterium]
MNDVLFSSQGWSVAFLALLTLGVGLLLRWIWRRPVSEEPLVMTASESGETVVSPRQVFSSDEATLFNLIKLASQEHFLVLGKLSLLQLVSFLDQDEEARRALMRNIQTLRLDVVLIHPGIRQAKTVIKFRKEKEGSAVVDERERLMETILKAAGIGLVRLSVEQTYSVEQLVGLLGLAEEE